MQGFMVLRRLALVLAEALTAGREIKLPDGCYCYDETKFGTDFRMPLTRWSVGWLEVPKTEEALATWNPIDGTGFHLLEQK